jgi:probable rRNA maturation factor
MREYRIEVLVDDAYAGQVSPGSLRAAAAQVLELQQVQSPCGLAIVVSGDGTLRQLNRRHRGVDAPTDVLAFPNAPAGSFVEAPEQSRYLGDVIISFSRASGQAAELGHDVEAELQLLVIHGVLHLLGYGDSQEAKRARMWAAQEEAVAALGIAVSYPD